MKREDLLAKMSDGATLTWWFTSYMLIGDEETLRVSPEVVEECLQATQIEKIRNTGSPVTTFRLTNR